MKTKKLIQIIKDHEVFSNERSLEYMPRRNYENLANALKEAINYSQCCKSDSELLPKRLSNEAYKKAQVMSYAGFVEWWDEQQV